MRTRTRKLESMQADPHSRELFMCVSPSVCICIGLYVCPSVCLCVRLSVCLCACTQSTHVCIFSLHSHVHVCIRSRHSHIHVTPLSRLSGGQPVYFEAFLSHSCHITHACVGQVDNQSETAFARVTVYCQREVTLRAGGHTQEHRSNLSETSFPGGWCFVVAW